MVNMYSMQTGGYNSMFNSGNGGNGINVHQNFKAKYGVGPEDLSTRPYAQPYPMAVVPRRPEPIMDKSWFGRFLKKCFAS